MREIKFRGKTFFHGGSTEWWYVTPDSEAWQQFWVLVDRGSLGQYIGLKDCTDKEVYEGDIAEVLDDDGKSVLYAISFSEGAFCFDVPRGAEVPPYSYPISSHMLSEWRVVGNIYENAEMVNNG